MKKLSVFSVVKNESALIEGMLESARGADEHWIIDTGSTDDTIAKARKYTENIDTSFIWNDSFADAKNHALSKCTGDYIIGLDADCRFKEGAVQTLKDFIQTADKDVYRIPLIWNDAANPIHHWLPKLFRRDANIHFTGNVHEYPSKIAEGDVMAPIIFLYSANHALDKDRNIRMLLKDDLTKPRNQFYLGREYYERKRYEEAIEWLAKYVQSNSWAPEKAEGYLTLARCYWFTNQGDKAREACGKAILINPDFREALKMMALMHYEPNKSKWQKLADISTNADVLFVRT